MCYTPRVKNNPSCRARKHLLRGRLVRGTSTFFKTEARSLWRPLSLSGLGAWREGVWSLGYRDNRTCHRVDTSPRPALLLSAVCGGEEPRPGKRETRFQLPALPSLDEMQTRTCPALSFLVGTCLREQASDQRTLRWLKAAQGLAGRHQERLALPESTGMCPVSTHASPLSSLS